MIQTLIVMLKEPRPGQVKTRLGRDIGMTEAAWWFRHQTRHLLRGINDPRWQTILAVAPDVAGLESRFWPAHLARMPQGPGHLGDRMARMLRATAPGRSCLIGSDVPGVTPAHINRAFKALGDHDAVFGPAPDGGYWLVGLKHPARQPHGFLQNTRWSTEHALADSRAALPGLRIATTDILRDVDTADDLP